MEALGLKPWVPTQLRSRKVKEKKERVWYKAAYVPKLMFCVIPAIYYREVLDLKHVIGKPLELSRMDIEGVPEHNGPKGLVAAKPGLRDFQAAVDAEYEKAARIRDKNEMTCDYVPGQALELLSGPWAGFQAIFKDVIQTAHDEFAKVRVEMELFGSKREVTVDPDGIRAA